ncbi:MAG: peptidoglycan DD-metalloendopeptidase family protein [Bacilli bacterium]|nr:peptidoglycan DD-metalloendopeptidase family protein [Bacilli bacterium]
MKKINEEKLIKYLRSLILRSLTVIVLFLILAILSKSSEQYKDTIVTNLYEKHISFTTFKNLYTKYLGGIVPLDKVTPNVNPVFNEELEYTNESIYHDGVRLEVTSNYLVPIIEEGMVVYIGEKENYGNVVIIEGIDGIDIWYGNMETTTIELYDYVEKGNYLGQITDNTLYLVYEKEGKFLDYKEYLK